MPTTMENLATAFAGESQANRKYLAFAKRAEGEGLCPVCGDLEFGAPPDKCPICGSSKFQKVL